MDQWVGKVAIVTGASSGIGAAAAEKLVKCGLKVVGLARREERLLELAKKLEGSKGKLFAIKADVTKEEDILKAFNWVTENVGIVHILVNNAGIFRPNGLLNGETQHWKEIMDTNFIALCICTREAIKIMRNNAVDGCIIHINSISGHHQPKYPNTNLYPASKFAVKAVTETLRQELNVIGSKVKVTSISPGHVRTEVMLGTGSKLIYEQSQLLPMLEPEDVADAILYVLGTPPQVQVGELIIRPIGEDL